MKTWAKIKESVNKSNGSRSTVNKIVNSGKSPEKAKFKKIGFIYGTLDGLFNDTTQNYQQ